MALPKKTHCIRGHERTPDNLYNGVHCKTCATIARNLPENKLKRKKYLLENKQILSEKSKEYRKDELIQQRLKEYQKTYRKSYIKTEHGMLVRKKQAKKEVDNANKHYIAHLLKLPVNIMTTELYELKKMTLQLKRSLKCQSNQAA